MKDITPREFRCGLGQCPAIYELSGDNKDKIAVVGKIDHAVAKEVSEKMGSDEFVVVIDRAMLEGAVSKSE